MKTNSELTEAYHIATSNYEVAKGDTDDHLDAFTELLVAERLLATRVGYWFDQSLGYFWEHYSL